MISYLTPSIKINSGWIIDLSVKGKTMKLLFNTGQSIHDIQVSTDFLNRTKQSLTPKEKH